MDQSLLSGCSKAVVLLCVQVHLSIDLLLVHLHGYHDDVLE